MLSLTRKGQGTYSCVYELDGLALKRNLVEQESSFLNSIRELNVLYLLRQHPNIVKLEEVVFGEKIDNKCFSPIIGLGDEYKDMKNDSVHFLFQKADQDLHDYIYKKGKRDFKMLKKYMVDILYGLEYMHDYKLIHRDIKPSNILLFGDTAKLCDFGFTKPFTFQGDQTPGIMTVLYRAPEVLLSDPNYDYKVDVWSVGCVFFEMIARRSFVEEEEDDDAKILKNILDVLPVALTKEQFKKWVINSKYRQFTITNSKQSKKRFSFYDQLELTKYEKLNFDAKGFSNLLGCMLAFNKDIRYTIKECINDPFFDFSKTYDNVKVYKKEYPLRVINCKEREWMSQTATCLFNSQEDLEWYNHRCLFQAIDLFYRYLYVMHTNLPPNNNLIESELTGKIHDKFNTNLLFMGCIYITIKYFSTIHYPIPFSSIVKEEFLTPQCLIKVEQFEGGLIKNCLEYDIYHETVYEVADEEGDILSTFDIRNLLMMITLNQHIDNFTPLQLYRHYKNISDKTDMNNLLLPIT